MGTRQERPRRIRLVELKKPSKLLSSMLHLCRGVLLTALLAFGSMDRCLSAAEEQSVYSGPQLGEKTTGFKVLAVQGDRLVERDPVAENKAGPVAVVFIHNLERSLVPLLRVVDEYGAHRKERLRTEIVFLSEDRVAGELRMKSVVNSLKLKANVGLSVDGAEGPGNYGLNKNCMMTIIAAKDDKVTANFALIQPGIADAPKVLEALANVCGDTNPPTVAALSQAGPAMRRGEMPAERAWGQRSERDGKSPFPGAVPTDEKLVGLLRQFIRPTNDEATVNRVFEEVRSYVKGDVALRQQAIDGWTRVLHFQDRYGTPYARQKGAELLLELKKQ